MLANRLSWIISRYKHQARDIAIFLSVMITDRLTSKGYSLNDLFINLKEKDHGYGKRFPAMNEMKH